jgi:signal transduction histidine kinase
VSGDTSTTNAPLGPGGDVNPSGRISLKLKLLVLFVSTSALIVMAFAGITYNRLRKERIALIQESVSQQLQGFDFSLKSFFTDVEGDVSSLAGNELVRSRDDSQFTSFLTTDTEVFKYNYAETEKRIIQLFNTHRLSHPYVNSVYMGRENGSFVRSHPRERPTRYDPRERPWYVQAKASPGVVVMTAPYPSLTAKDVNIGVVTSLVDEHGVFYGVVGMDVTIANLTNYALSFKTRPAGSIFLTDRHGIVLASHDSNLHGKDLEKYSPTFQSLITKGGAGVETLDILGKRNFLFYQSSTQQDWRIAVLIPAESIEREIRGPVLWMVCSLSVGLVLLSGFILLGLHLVVIHPLRRLTWETDYVTRTGDLSRRIEIRSRDEIGDLARSYQKMVVALGVTQDSLRNAEKHLTEYRAHLEDMVAQRTGELESTLEELALARDRALSADRLKSAFLATMSHELRTPLNSIIGFSGVLLQGLAGPLSEEQSRQLGMVCNSADHLLALINDVLDLSKIEAGQMPLLIEPFDLCASIRGMVGAAGPLGQKKGLTLLVDIEPSIKMISSDRRRVEQVLLNLLSNSIKFTERGQVRVEAFQRDGRVTIGVIDTGMGIQEKDLDKLFRPFTQLDTGIARTHEGTGLGLSICRKLIEMLGGVIRVETAWGKGTRFSFELPIDGGKT